MPAPTRRSFTPVAETFNKCPSGHALPHAIEGLDCSTTQCAATIQPKEAPSPMLEGNEERQFENEVKRAQRTESYRRKLVPVPMGLTGAEADDYVERRITELQPVAIAEMERQLRFGNDSERAKAARDILDAGGHGKKDRIGASANMIVINMGGGPNGSPPPLPYVGQVVEAATKALKP